VTSHNESKDETVPLSRTSKRQLGQVASPTVTLLVYHRGGADVVPLQPGVPVVIGREPPADVVIADRNLSRQHARFLLDGGALVVEDLGSTNGTRVRGAAIERASLRMGEPVTLATVVVSAHAHTPLEPELQELDSHDRFCAALTQALTEARHFGEPLAILMLRSADGTHVSSWCQRVRGLLRPIDRAALYSPDTIEVLLPRMARADAVGHARALVAAAAARQLPLVSGLATYPDAATTPERLLERCLAALVAADPTQPIKAPPGDAAYNIPTGAHPVIVSAAMRALFEAAEKVAASALPVLIHGETGTGKEVLARSIHAAGSRRERPLVCVNCGAIPVALVVSTLFGHVQGAFTGADRPSQGVFGAADGGTVLLDEIGELPLEAQAALLRVLEAGRMARVGSPDEVPVDVRVLAATHRDLEAMCDAGRFRRDLLYRLNALTLSIPPLRERREEIPPLAERFLHDAAAAASRPIVGISAEAMGALVRYRWPGNLRELRNAIERAVVIARGDRIGLEDLPQRVAPASSQAAPPEPAVADDPQLDLRSRVRRFEAWAIVEALRAEDGNKTHAARRLQVPLRTLMHKIKLLGVESGEREPGEP
jgi:DNA-binding NtrC family response regulator